MSPMYHPSNARRGKVSLPASLGRVNAIVLLTLLLPVALVNSLLSWFSGARPLRRVRGSQGISHLEFRSGWLRDQWALFLVIDGALNWFDHKQTKGLVSERKLRALSGLSTQESNAGWKQTNRTSSVWAKTTLLLRYGFAKLFYSAKRVRFSKRLSLFGIQIDNLSMAQAVTALLSPRAQDHRRSTCARTACFVNVNSFNLAKDNLSLHRAIKAADIVLADGSGVRLAAQRKGTPLIENVNGTDLLPHLCAEAVKSRLSIFLLGGANGVAEEASAKLRESYPGLKIDASHHGYFSESENANVVDEINNTHADIVLVALGSPVQELWLQTNKHRLNARVAIAVGGLFDFFSGRIPRAPLWLRELGMEWVWRLLQEPKAKFKRYVLGNPAFLYRILRHKNTI